MRAALVASDLLLSSRIEDAAQRSEVTLVRVSSPAGLPDPHDLELVLVDWSERDGSWGSELKAWLAQATTADRPRLVLFGPHTDLDAHGAARDAGLGPMWARSRLVRELPELFGALRTEPMVRPSGS